MTEALIVYNAEKKEGTRQAAHLKALLGRRGVKARVLRSGSEPRTPATAALVIALGGDGTMLRAARLSAGSGVRVLGVNAGGLGFLTGVELRDFKRLLPALLGGRFREEVRWPLTAEARRGSHKVFGAQSAINDCVLRCGDQARAVSLEASLDGRFIARYFGDGLIVSTPTGSTAYALAASGPLVHPRVDAFLMTPICPHMMTQRPLVLPSDGEIRLKLVPRRVGESPSVLLSLDGQNSAALELGDEVIVRRSQATVRLLLSPEKEYFGILREKLKWGER